MEKMEVLQTVGGKLTYSQDWPAYNKAQIQEKTLFMRLLHELCNEIEEPMYVFGRPKKLRGDMVFSSALKVYTTFSLRRFMTDMETALKEGYLKNRCSYSTVSNYMRSEKLTVILKDLIMLSAMPLKTVETQFAVDSSGLRTTKFSDYCREKHHMSQSHLWVKVHAICGVKTNIITAVELGFDNHTADSPQFAPLVSATAKMGFGIKEVSADKAYSSVANYNVVQDVGGQAYIPFKSNTTALSSYSKGTRGKLWRRMFHYFQLNQEEFLEHYHKRSNIESTFFMIKAKFTDLIRSKDETAQINEVLLKVLCHNICVLIQQMFELGIEPDFLKGETT